VLDLLVFDYLVAAEAEAEAVGMLAAGLAVFS
jgi:hypothetical protein